MQITTIGLDLAKHWFQVHGVDANGHIVVRDGEWVRTLLARKPTKLAAVALANKTARSLWAVMMRGDGYQPKEVFGQPA
jgi:transposase